MGVAFPFTKDYPAAFTDVREPPFPIKADLPFAAVHPAESFLPVPLADSGCFAIFKIIGYAQILHPGAVPSRAYPACCLEEFFWKLFVAAILFHAIRQKLFSLIFSRRCFLGIHAVFI